MYIIQMLPDAPHIIPDLFCRFLTIPQRNWSTSRSCKRAWGLPKENFAGGVACAARYCGINRGIHVRQKVLPSLMLLCKEGVAQ